MNSKDKFDFLVNFNSKFDLKTPENCFDALTKLDKFSYK